MILNQDTQRKYAIIDALVRLEKPTMKDLIDATNIPEPTMKRQIALLRKESLMDIRFVRTENTQGRGKSGYYFIADWGIINPTKFISEFGGRIPPE